MRGRCSVSSRHGVRHTTRTSRCFRVGTVGASSMRSPGGAPEQRARLYGSLSQRVAIAASLWVAASLALAIGTFWWQLRQAGGIAGLNLSLLVPAACFALISAGLRAIRWHSFLEAV